MFFQTMVALDGMIQEDTRAKDQEKVCRKVSLRDDAPSSLPLLGLFFSFLLHFPNCGPLGFYKSALLSGEALAGVLDRYRGPRNRGGLGETTSSALSAAQ